MGTESDCEGSQYEGLVSHPESPGGKVGGSDLYNGMLSPSGSSGRPCRHFIVQVDRTGGSKVGLDMGYEDHKTLLIKCISPDGLIAAWNDTNPGLRVVVGDRIVEVNGLSGKTRGVRPLMDEMRSHQILNLTVQRELDEDEGSADSTLPRLVVPAA